MKVLIADGVSQEAVDILADFECVKKDKLSAEELLEIIPECSYRSLCFQSYR